MARHASCCSVALLCVGLCLCFEATALAQQRAPAAASPSPPAASSGKGVTTPTAPVPADAKPDPGAQIDELIQQSTEAMNVKVQFQRSEELARQALELSEKAGDKARAANAMVYLSAAISYQGRIS